MKHATCRALERKLVSRSTLLTFNEYSVQIFARKQSDIPPRNNCTERGATVTVLICSCVSLCVLIGLTAAN